MTAEEFQHFFREEQHQELTNEDIYDIFTFFLN